MSMQESITVLQWIHVFFLFDLCAIAIGATVYQLTGDRTARVESAAPLSTPEALETPEERRAA
jgi:hypothetical protein